MLSTPVQTFVRPVRFDNCEELCPRASQVVSTQYPFGLTPRNPQNTVYHFYGSFTDSTFGPFGALAVGQHLTVRVVVKVSRYTAYPSYPVTVVQASGCPSK